MSARLPEGTPRRFRTRRWPVIVALVLCVLRAPVTRANTQVPTAEAPSAAELSAAIDALGHLDYEKRSGAARLVRRTPGAQAVPALLRAVAEHPDGYVRFRALVLLVGFNDPRTAGAMREAMSSPNDRLRTVAYGFFQRHPDPSLVPTLLAALDKEQAEFVRPALVRALAAHGADDRVRAALVRDVGRGEDLFRGAVIEALGEHEATYAIDAILTVARLDGPLQDDAVVALGRIGDKRVLPTLSELQSTAPRERQPALATAICLLDVNCASHESYLVRTLQFTDRNLGFQPLLRAAAGGLGALAIKGRASALTALLDVGISSQDPTRAPVALAVATTALRNGPLMVTTFGTYADQMGALPVLAEGFDMLEEDLEKERFFALARSTYWASPEGSASRSVIERLIKGLNF